MLSCEQIAELAGAICATAEAMGQTISAGGAKVIAEDLAAHEPQVIVGALRACRREPAGRLSLGMVLKHIHAADGRPGKDEAWSIALSASDEHETVVMTAEIRQAMAASNPILEAGDKVGARMAFMSAYERLVSFARAEDRPTAWEVSLGFDAARRVAAIESAVRAQLITHEAGTKYLADLRIAPVTADGQAIAGLLTGEVRTQPSAAMREKLAEVRLILTASKARKDQERAKDNQRRRVSTYLRKRQARSVIAEMDRAQ
ncbi:hypothetical protein [Pseudomonas juntendi]|uniref:hypothetical protein n=1 Tax=Pseudomonas juntendi TaxID=2666183 RepID=UPI0021B2A538|nr:hypothetical protein [Pseudomonas juntendi]UXA36971.1 hypothetical protein KZA81_15775 [Pseudomonas juntendi]